MQDLLLDQSFSITLDETNDIATVSGQRAFEQQVVVHATSNLQDAFDPASSSVIRERIRLAVSRVARELKFIDSIAQIAIERAGPDGATFEVEVVYEAGDSFQFEVEP